MVEFLNSKRSDIFLVLSIVRFKMQSEKRKQMRAVYWGKRKLRELKNLGPWKQIENFFISVLQWGK